MTKAFIKIPDSPDCVCTSGDSLSFSPNRAFFVETFTVLISQKQTPLSSDTEQQERTFRGFFFILPHFVSSLVFFYLFSYYPLLTLQTVSEVPDQQESRYCSFKDLLSELCSSNAPCGSKYNRKPSLADCYLPSAR